VAATSQDCAFVPVATGGPVVDAVWRRLPECAGQRPAQALTGDPDARLNEAFHAFEGGDRIRWTDGDAALPTAAFARPPEPSSAFRSKAARPNSRSMAKKNSVSRGDAGRNKRPRCNPA
jgi:hypothetical protein